jgi:hypothetical protein
MKTEICEYGGWSRNLKFSNETAEVIVSLEVGPRIISYRLIDHDNILKNYDEQIGQAGEDAWMIRGGHRLWIAPEDEKVTYHWDNEPVESREELDGTVTFLSTQTEPLKIRKELAVRLADQGSRVEVNHTAVNEGDEPICIATWGLTVMAPGGLEILPQPPMGSHPEDLLPNRTLVLWPYTDLTDERLHLGRTFITLRQDENGGPIKFGLAHRMGWAAYLLADCLFLKSFDFIEGETYPDFGCNFETFTNSSMLEIETLSPLRNLLPGQSVTHRETWHLFELENELVINTEEQLAEWIAPFLAQAGLA